MKISNYLLWGMIESFLKFIAHAVYGIFSFFHLGAAFFYALAGAIIHLIWNVMRPDTAFFRVYHIIGAGLLIYAVIATALSILGIGKKPKSVQQSGVQIINEEQAVAPRQKEDRAQSSAERKERKSNRREEEQTSSRYPVYSRVKSNTNYVMAEYADRYELYYATEHGYRYIRTDYKPESDDNE